MVRQEDPIDSMRSILRRLATEAKESKSKPLIKKVFDSESNEWKKKIITGSSRGLVACYGESVVIINSDFREKTKKDYKRKFKNKLLPRQDAIIYSGHPESTFDKKVRDLGKKNRDGFPHTPGDGPPFFHTDDLDKFSKLILDLCDSALCINTHYCFDIRRNGFLPFKGGEYYKIIEEQEKFVYLYIERFNTSLKLSNKQFSFNFRRKEDLSF